MNLWVKQNAFEPQKFSLVAGWGSRPGIGWVDGPSKLDFIGRFYIVLLVDPGKKPAKMPLLPYYILLNCVGGRSNQWCSLDALWWCDRASWYPSSIIWMVVASLSLGAYINKRVYMKFDARENSRPPCLRCDIVNNVWWPTDSYRPIHHVWQWCGSSAQAFPFFFLHTFGSQILKQKTCDLHGHWSTLFAGSFFGGPTSFNHSHTTSVHDVIHNIPTRWGPTSCKWSYNPHK